MTKVLGIIGASFSGTTMTTMMLGAIPGWFPAGETHWLRDDPNSHSYCRACDGLCTEWIEDLRGELQTTERWWESLRAGLSQYDWLVSSDKIPNFYAENQGVDHYVLQWKDPRSWYCSAKRHQEGTEMNARQAATAWSDLYYHAFDLIDKGNVPVSFMNWDAFCESPLQGLNRLLADVGVDPVTQLPTKNPRHMIGGNREAIGLNRSLAHQELFGESIRPDTRWMSMVDADEARAVIEDPCVAEVLASLESRRRRALDPGNSPNVSRGGARVQPAPSQASDF